MPPPAIDLSLVLPAYNEAATIGRTIASAVSFLRARRLSYEVIVAADGDDGTREAVAALAVSDPRLSVLGSRERRGKGRGVREAVALAQGEVVGYADADDKVPIEELDRLLPLLAGEADVVIGTRAHAAARIERPAPWYRRAGSRAFAVAVRAVVGLEGISDTQCGFKFFRREAARRLFALSRVDGYMFDVEVLALAQELGYRVREVPIRWRDDGDSRLQLVAGNLRNARDLLRIRAARGRARA